MGGQDEDRPLLLLWLQNLPWPWPHLGQGRWQELQVPVLPHPQGAHAEKEPQEDHLDRSVPQEAQEGSRGGCDQEEDSPRPEVPACRCWSNSAGHHGEEEPSLRCEKPRESRLCAPPRTRRRPLLRSPLLRTRPRRRPRRQQRTLPRPDPAGLAASDKYFAVE